jgi:hypothetical protein
MPPTPMVDACPEALTGTVRYRPDPDGVPVPAVGAHLAPEAGSVVGDAFWVGDAKPGRVRRRFCQNVALRGRLAGATPTEFA